MVWGMLNFAVCQIGAFLVFLLLARVLEPAVFGVFAVAVVALDLVAVQGKYAMIDAIVIEGALTRHRLSDAFWVCMAVCIVTAALLGVGFQVIEPAIGMDGLGGIGVALSATLLLIPLQTATEAQLFGQMQVRSLALRNIAMTVFGAIAGVGVAFSPHPEWALAAQRAAQTLAATLLLWLATRFVPSIAFDRPSAIALARRAAGIWRNFIIAVLPRFVVQIALGASLGAALLGVYRILERFADLVQQALVAPLMNLVVPVLSRFDRDPPSRADQALSLMRNAAAFSVPAVAGLAVLAPEAMRLLVEPEVAKEHTVLSLLALAGLSAPLTLLRLPILGVLKQNAALTLQLLFDVALAGLVVWLLAPRGLTAVASGLCGVALVGAGFGLWSIARGLGVRKRRVLEAIGPAYLGAAMMMAVLFIVLAAIGPSSSANSNLMAFVRLGALISVGFCTYGAYLLIAHRAWLLSALRTFRQGRMPIPESD